ncbi:hypothetical protein ACVWZ4_000730 [Bradyrhizobium sp. USDA 4472]
MQPRLRLSSFESRPSTTQTIDIFAVVAPCVALAFGFFVQFNIMTATFGLPFLRLTDALMFLFLPLLFIVVGIGRTVRDGLLYFVVLCLVVAASLLGKTGVEQGDVYMTLIFFLTSVFAFFLVEVAQDEHVLMWLAAGILLGLIPSIAVLFLQAGGAAGLANIGLGVPIDETTSPMVAAFAKTKFGGMWIHGNEAGHVYAVATASAFYLAFRFRQPLIYVGYYGLLVATFAVTLNRSGLIAPTIALIYLYKKMGTFRLYVGSAIAAIIAVVILFSLPNAPALDTLSDSIETRFVDDSHAESNVFERAMSNIQGVQVAVENPFGIGYNERIAAMGQKTTTGIVSVHNGFLSLANQSGLAVILLYLTACTYLFVNRRTISLFYLATTAFTVTSMCFEELSINPFFIFSVAITIAAAWLHYSKSAQMKIARQPKLVLRPFALRRPPH